MKKKVQKFLHDLKKQGVTASICAVITAVCLGGLWMHYSGKGGFASDFIELVETKLLDFRFLLRGPIKPTGKVGVLAIDEKTIQRFGRWPFSRSWYEQSFSNLKKLDVKLVGFDVTFSEPERPLLQEAGDLLTKIKLDGIKGGRSAAEWDEIEKLKHASKADQSLQNMIKSFGNIVMGFFYYAAESDAEQLGEKRFTTLDKMVGSGIEMMIFPDGKELKDYPTLQAKAAVGNTEFLTSAGKHFAFFNNESDDDAIMRWVTLVRSMNGSLMPSLSLKTAAESLGRVVVVFFDKYGVEEVGLVNPEDDSDIIKIPVDPEGFGRVLINHYGPSKSIQHFSLADAFDNSFTADEKAKLKGMTLLLGPTAIAINDQRANPFDAGLNGVEDHAAIVDNIIAKKFMKRPANIYKTELLLVLAIGLLFSPIMIFTRASNSGIAVVLFAFGYYYFDKYYWFNHGVWAYMGMPYFSIASLFVAVTLYKYMTEEREKKKVKGAFAFYLSPEVIDKVLEDPNALKLGGTKKELTVFFSDVRGFTTISESLDAEKLGELMNNYFTPMEGIIKRSGGTLDKYIGDAIMAFWGAPIEFADSPDRACVAALQMLYELDKVREALLKRGLPKIDIGIGLNTGLMSVGNFGSDERFCYTVMGDEVNLGSRLEGSTKEYKIKAMVSDKTVQKVTRKDLFFRDLDDLKVKGKNEPVKVFELIRPDYLPQERLMHDLVNEFGEGRKAYRAQDWNKAQAHFLNCMKLRPDDGPAEIYMSRVEEFKSKPRIENWDGVFVMTHK